MLPATNAYIRLVLTATLFQVAAPATAADPNTDSAPATEAPALTPAETEFVALVDSFFAKLEPFWEHTRNITDTDELEAYYKEHDPARTYLPKLLEFERTHAGEDVGVDALAEVVVYAGRGGGPEAPGYRARREALARLKEYEDRELTTSAIDSLSSGDYDSQVVEYLRRVAHSPTAHPTVSAVAARTLADELLSHSAARQQIQMRLDALADGLSPTRPGEADEYRDYLARLPSAESAAAGRDEAIALLNDLVAAQPPIHQPGFRAISKPGRIMRVDPERTKSSPLISDQAAAMLFKENHLRTGSTPPQLERGLIDGTPWNLAAQGGRVVVIQFSFTGCGPCAEMYPDLRELHAKYREDLSILTIMRDETSAPALLAIKDGKITWNVTCEGVPGEVSTKWAVDSYPQIYIIDQKGQIAATNLRGEFLKHRVAKLIAEE